MTDDALTLPPPPLGRSGGIVRRSLALLGRRGGPSWALAFAILTPVALIGAFLARHELDQPFTEPATGFGGIGVSGISVGLAEGLVITPIVFAAVFVMMALALPARDAFALARGRWPALIVTMFLTGVISFLPVVPGAVLFAFNLTDALSGDAPGGALALGGLLFMAGVPVALFLGLSLSLAVPLAAVDGQRAVDAVLASWRRMDGQRWRMLGGYLALTLPFVLVAMVGMLVLGLIATALGSGVGWVLIGLGDGAFNALMMVLITSVDAIVYADTAPAPVAAPDEDPPMLPEA